METGSKKNPVVALLTSPWSILVSVGISAFIGIMFKDVAALLRPFGTMYLYLIEMTVIPIIISAVVSSVAGLAKSTGIRAFLLRMVVVFILMLVSIAVIGTLAGVIGSPGSGLDEGTRNTLGSIIKTEQSKYAPDLELSLKAPLEAAKTQTSFIDFLVQMVPRNIFAAMTAGRALELIFFSIILGIAVGVLGARHGTGLIDIFDGLFKAFQKIISWLMVLLPFGLICLLSYQIAETGFSILKAMMKFILVFYIVGAAVFVADVLIIWRRSRMGLGKVLKALLDPIVISMVTRSSFATLPSAIRSLSQNLGFYERSTNLFFSMGTTIGRFGNILYFAVASIFVAQLYGAPMGIWEYGKVTLGSLLAGIATAGASGIATLNLLGIVLGSLSLPLEAVLIIFIAIDTIADPMRTLLIVITNMAANTLIVPRVETLNRRGEGGRTEPSGAIEGTDMVSRIMGRGEMVVALDRRDASPFYSGVRGGEPEGTAIDCAKALAEKLGVRIRFDRKAANQAELVSMIKENKADIAVGMCNFHKVFGGELAYSEPYAATREAMLADKLRLAKIKKGDNLLASLKTYEGSVGAVEGSVHEKTAARIFAKARISAFPSVEDMADAVFEGRIVAAFGNEVELRAALDKRPSSAAGVSVVVFGNLSAEMRLGVSPRFEGSLALINGVVSEKRMNPAGA